jgi:hypothetical protein
MLTFVNVLFVPPVQHRQNTTHNSKVEGSNLTISLGRVKMLGKNLRLLLHFRYERPLSRHHHRRLRCVGVRRPKGLQELLQPVQVLRTVHGSRRGKTLW